MAGMILHIGVSIVDANANVPKTRTYPRLSDLTPYAPSSSTLVCEMTVIAETIVDPRFTIHPTEFPATICTNVRQVSAKLLHLRQRIVFV